MHRAVLFPQQLPRGVLVALQLLMDVSEVGQSLGFVQLAGDSIARKQLLLQLRFRHLRRQRPAQSRCLKPLQVLVHCALTDVGAAGDLPLPQLQLEVQP